VSTGTVSVTIPTSTAQETYYLLACADDTVVVVESTETNNCRASATTVQVGAPDLVVTTVSDPPATAVLGGSFGVTETVRNQGPTAAGGSTTRYYLSLDTLKNSGDRLLTGNRVVPGLAPGTDSPGSATVTIKTNMPLGTYYLLACADDTVVVVESTETNNCRASATTVQVGAPDLVVTTISDPPATAVRGGSFGVTETVRNQGSAAAGVSTARYYLSLDTLKSSSDQLLTGKRVVPGLAPGTDSPGNATVTIPTSTPVGTYYLLACADDKKVVAESNEGNNCQASVTTVVVSP
jgi:subtilase family serine protease